MLILWLSTCVVLSQQNVHILARPTSGNVLDLAQMLSPQDIASINHISDGAKRQAQAPIVVVTVPSLASVGAHNTEWYATTLFNAWAIGDRRSNRGVLLFVAQADRKARIEMGAGWGYTRDADCQKIMDGWIIPEFKKGNFSSGIIRGVQALDSLVRDGRIPRKPWPPWVLPVIVFSVIFLILMAINIARHGMDGWAGSFLRLVGEILMSPPRSRYYSSGGSWNDDSGGWGGGGASGSW